MNYKKHTTLIQDINKEIEWCQRGYVGILCIIYSIVCKPKSALKIDY